jgi:hypothetical protein
VTKYEWKKQWNMSTEADEDNECVLSGFYDRRVNPTIHSPMPVCKDAAAAAAAAADR